MAMNANKKAVNRVEELQKTEKNWLQRSDVILFKSDLKKKKYVVMIRFEKKVFKLSLLCSLYSFGALVNGQKFYQWYDLVLGFNQAKFL